jgi:predicted small secreted protein
MMNYIRIILLLIVSCTLLIGCKSTYSTATDIDSIHRQLKWGVKQYERGNYEQAFEELSPLAAWGYKDAQYAMALLFLKGDYVEQSELIGMAWLNVACESDIEQWQELYDKLLTRFPDKKRTKLTILEQDYIAKFGVKTQRMSCVKDNNGFSKRMVTRCTREDRKSPVYPIDMTENTIKLVTDN